ncbi:YozE family protein [Chitinophaga varians]|uniref:YozE family protein n=1 Tax=Chitinophaga varians TaxID=2202339 RepID=UPI00165FBF63|nr:YozE family protein [Chitinophaga varians]MBC9911031.1 hypothetical protein [Chitinophaga varians]
MLKNKITLTYIKAQAKKFKRTHNVTYTKALDKIAKEYGYSNWMHCQRSLSQTQSSSSILNVESPVVSPQLSFSDWLKRHKNRNSPLGDLAKDTLRDRQWPENNSLEEYVDYLNSRNAYFAAVDALRSAWKSYKAYLKRSNSPKSKAVKKPRITSQKDDSRTIVYVNGVTPIHFPERNVEVFKPGDKAWISYNTRKALPVTVIEVDDRHYTVRIERPLKVAGDMLYFLLDEVRSTPELACRNYVTL